MSSVDFDAPPNATVTGDWLPDEHEGYPARVAGLWNGWAIPLFSRDVAKRVCEDQEAVRAKVRAEKPELTEEALLEMAGELRYDSDSDAVVYRDAYGESTIRPEPYGDGGGEAEELFELALGWTWTTEEPLPNVSPTEAQKARLESIAARSVEMGAQYRVRPDGSHAVPVLAELEDPVGENGSATRAMTTIAVIVIDRDGRASAEAPR